MNIHRHSAAIVHHLQGTVLKISNRGQVILPHHKLLDGMREKGDKPVGTTLRGIGPTYEDKVGRRGVRIGTAEIYRQVEQFDEVGR